MASFPYQVNLAPDLSRGPVPAARPREDWGNHALTFIFLLFLLETVAWSVMSASWVKPAPWLPLVVLLAGLAGLALAKLRAPGLLLFPAGLALGCLVVLWQVIGTLPGETWGRQLEEFWTRLNLWLEVVGTGGVSNDPLALALLLTFFTWLVGYVSAWCLYRSLSLWGATLPGALAITTNLNYLPDYSLPLYLFLLAALLLGMRVHFLRKRSRWPFLTWGAFPVRQSLAFGLAIVLISGATPLASISHPPLLEYWAVARSPWSWVETEFGRLFAGIPARKPLSRRYFGRAYPLHGSAGLGDQVVLRVSSEYPGYWRARSYDTYTGQGWLASQGQHQPLRGQETEAQEDYNHRARITQKVEIGVATEFLFAAGQPLEITLPAEVEVLSSQAFDIDLRSRSPSLPPDLQEVVSKLSQKGSSPSFEEVIKALPRETALISPVERGRLKVQRIGPSSPDVSALHPSSPASKGTVYEVTSSVSVAKEEDLRRAGADYPAWVSDLYMQLSPSLPSRVRELSREMTQGAGTPYEKARMIEDYLRTLGYRHEANPPPARADAVDYFLFTLREGHCDYFATAMAVMLRSVGVPARIAVGFSTGDWDNQEKTYVVRERHAHAWPEVFFPDLGWVKFEPTPSQPLVARGDPRLPKASEDEDLSLSNQGYLEEDDFLYGSGEAIPMLDSSPWEWGRIASVAGIALGGLTGMFLFLLGLVFLFWRLSLRGLGHGERCYENMCRLASWGRLAHQPQQTPREYANALSSALPRYEQEIHHIAGCYTDMRYGRKALSDAECESLACAWQTLRGGLLRRLLRRS